MRIILIGASGDVGKTAFDELSSRHDVIAVGRQTKEVQVDIGDRQSIEAMYEAVGDFDAVVCAAGHATFAPLADFTEESFMVGLQNKLMGQVNLVLAGLDRISENGSFTLTSGVLDRDPILSGAGAATANGGLAGFVKSAAIEMPRGLRINVVSPGLLETSEARYGAYFHGHERVPSTRVGQAFAKSVEGKLTGQVIIIE
jgi:NAD(P)-dependent dehydrogenase (short-subunit alcohol dehydrogenase family)